MGFFQWVRLVWGLTHSGGSTLCYDPVSFWSSHILCSAKEKQVLISFGHTKGGNRQGAAESVALGVEQGVLLEKGRVLQFSSRNFIW